MLTLPSKAGAGISECSVDVSPAPRAFPRVGECHSFWPLEKMGVLYALSTLGQPSPLVRRAFAVFPKDKKQPFFAQNSPSKGSKQPYEGKRLLHSTCGLTFSRPRDLWCPLTPRYVRETAQNGAKKPQNLRNVHQHPETQNGPYLGLRGSKMNSEGT